MGIFELLAAFFLAPFAFFAGVMFFFVVSPALTSFICWCESMHQRIYVRFDREPRDEN